jgi:hypothetical protein
VRFDDIEAGDLFGEFAAIDGEPRTADVVAVTDTLVACLSADQFWDLLRQHATVCNAIMRRITGIIRSTQQRVVEFSTLPVRGRLHAELLRLARPAAADEAQAVISPVPTHAEIASRISTHREAVTRELSGLARAGLIEKRGTDLIICDVATLAGLVEEALDDPGAGVGGARGAGRRTDQDRRRPIVITAGHRPAQRLSAEIARARC